MFLKRTCSSTSACGAFTPLAGLKPWHKLILGFVLVWVCIFLFGHLSRFIPGAARMAQVIDERNLRATAIYYTDLEESYEGSQYIRHNLEYPSAKPAEKVIDQQSVK
jgi:hypothetical protein